MNKIVRPSPVRSTRPICARRSASSAAAAAAAASNGTARIADPRLQKYVSVIATNLARNGGKIMKLPLITASVGVAGVGTRRYVNAFTAAPYVAEMATNAKAAGKTPTSAAHVSVATTRSASVFETSTTSASAENPGRSSSVATGVTQSSGRGSAENAEIDSPRAEGLGVRGSARASTSALGRAIHADIGDSIASASFMSVLNTGASGAANASSMSLATAPPAPISVDGD
mmetsp:Transcript_1649/g.7357  ORF Transcript_1649/g.7357 Transcript_1649/m.7357 type:complete len:230 (+) Transcript_1649:606-1295(+)